RDVEWAQIVKEAIAADKPKYIVMMIGVHDRQTIRERAPTPAAAAARTTAPKQEPEPVAKDPELQARQSAERQNAELQEKEASAEAPAAAAPEPARPPAGATGPFEFRSEKWEAAYVRRIDATIAAMKSANVPVLWVGLPAQRTSRVSSDSVYLN